jgi:hypothetical protein
MFIYRVSMDFDRLSIGHTASGGFMKADAITLAKTILARL